ncbi:MAG: DNA repair protein RadC [Chloroflexi bacterium]|nr:DNA repair protein RadC [Chloroflexota bacterium]
MAEQEERIRYQARIHDLPSGDRPRERLRDAGPAAISNSELLAILLRTGGEKESALAMASRLLATFNGLAGLARSSFAALCAQRGLGEAKAAQIQAALELGKRLVAAQPEERPVIRSADDVARLLQGEMGLLDQEHMRVLLLNTRNQVLAANDVYRGNVHTAVVRIGELFREALRHNAPAIILAHNHPSGDPQPSPDDVAMTKQVIEAGELLDVEVLDHVVISHGGFVSMKQQGLAFR